MNDLLQWLSATGGVGIWILVYVAWKLETRIAALESTYRNFRELMNERHERTNTRLSVLEKKV